MAKLIKKLSVKTVFGGKSDILDFIGKGEKSIIRVVGICHKVEAGPGENDNWVRFKGQFKGINLATGEEFRSGACFLPSVASDILEPMVLNTDGAVEFGFDIAAAHDETSAVGYVYNATPLIDAGESDPIAALEAAAGIEAPKLSAPAPKETATPKKDEKKAEEKK